MIEDLLAHGVSPGEIVAEVRDPKKARGIAERGVQLREAAYDDRPALEAAVALLRTERSPTAKR